MSGNVIDLCPVGALTSRPARYQARSWELSEHDGIAPHDGVGSNLHVHVRRDKLMRVVPRENDTVNQTWISDRDRFSYQGLYSDDRLTQPMLRENGKLREVDWQEALRAAAKALKDADPQRLGVLVSPSATLEEHYLSAKLAAGLGCPNIDHRLRQQDFRDDAADPALPWLGQSIAQLASADAVLLVGSWLRKDQPMLNHRVRLAQREGAQILSINPVAFDFNYELDVDVVCAPSSMVRELAGVAAALGADTAGIEVAPDQAHQAIADALKTAENGTVLLGTIAQMHPDYSILRRLADAVATQAGVTLGFVGAGSDDTGAWMAGAVPHRDAGGAVVAAPGANAQAMLAEPMDAYLTVGFEPEMDVADPALMASALQAGQVIALSSYLSPWLQAHADVLLPISAYAETSGTYVNLAGESQSFRGVAAPQGEARPAWKVLRVLGNLTDVDGFDYVESTEVRDEVLARCEGLQPDNKLGAGTAAEPLFAGADWERIGGVPMYAVDAITRRAHALQLTPDAWRGGARINAAVAQQLGVDGEGVIRITQGEHSAELSAAIDDAVPDGCVWLPTAVPGSEQLGPGFGAVTVEKV
jgi:NADH-quinone oxidoreductase subunit G